MTFQYSKIVAGLLKVLPKRYQAIVSRRFGLKTGKPETLEAIGRDYKITRERVRQIEEAALKQIRSSQNFSELNAVFNAFRDHINSYGGLRGEFELFSGLAGSSRNYPHLNFLLELSGQFEKVPENDYFRSFWIVDKSALEQARKVLRALIQKLEEKGVPHSEEEFRELCCRETPAILEEKIEEPVLQSYLALSKEIHQGPFGHFGLRHWPEINPRGIRDKAYLVFKRQGSPLHFRELCGHINKTDFSKFYPGAGYQKNSGLKPARLTRKTNPQTVHNELIKDPRFVLVGRGIYALKDWGYSEGVVKDVIKKVLAGAKDPMHRDEIIARVLEQRKVKANTVLCNLHDRNCFKRLEDGRYTTIA